MRENYVKMRSDTDTYIEICISNSEWTNEEGGLFLEEDYRVDGEVWRVHKNDCDPFPSKPHAHCINGRFAGCKLHLGTGQRYNGHQALGKFLAPKQFSQLLELIKPKF